MIIAFSGGFLFDQLEIFLPWLLGPMFAFILAKRLIKNLYWPNTLRNIGLVILGIQIGSSFTKEALGNMLRNLPIMTTTTFLVIGFTIFSAFLIHRFTDLSFSTSVIGSFPGGLSQMVVLSEEIEDANQAVVAFMQTFRVILVITAVPWLVIHLLSSQEVRPFIEKQFVNDGLQGSYTLLHWIILLLLIFVLIFIGLKVKIPIPFLLGPVLATICLNIANAPHLAIHDTVLNSSQVFIGAHLGIKMNVDRNVFHPKLVMITFLSTIALIGFCLILAHLLHVFIGYSFNEIFLSIAPGGIAEMAITAMAVNADVSFVTSFHLFRILVILFIATPLVMKWIHKVKLENQEIQK